MMPSPDEMRATVERYVKMMCDSEIDGIIDLFADDAWAEDPVGGARIEGRENLRTFYGGAAPRLRVELTGPVRVAGNEAAFPLLAQLTLGDNTAFADVIDVMAFDEGGKLVSMRAYWNPAEMRPNR